MKHTLTALLAGIMVLAVAMTGSAGNKLQHGHLDADDGGTLTSAAIPANEIGTWASPVPTRSKDTVYQNTSGRKRRVAIGTYVSVLGANNGRVFVGDTNPPTHSLGFFGIGAQISTTDTTIYYVFSFEVPNGWYYRIATNQGAITISDWNELDE